MIQPNKDLFVHLSLVAKSMREDTIRNEFIPKKPILSDLEKTSYESVKPVIVHKKPIVEKSIEEVLDNSKIIALQKELENAEQIYNSLKQKEGNTDIILRIGNKLNHLRRIIERKTYF